MADTAVDKKETAAEEVTSTEVPKESPVKKSPAKKAESNGATENGADDAPAVDSDGGTPAENGDADDSNDATENGDDTAAEKKEAGVKRKSTAGEGEATDKTTPEKKAKVADEAPADADEVAA